VQEARADCFYVKFVVKQNVGNGHAVVFKIGVAGSAELAGVGFLGEVVGLLKNSNVLGGIISPKLIQHFLFCHILFTAALRVSSVSLTSFAWPFVKNFFGFWTLFNFSGLRRTLRPKYLLRPEKIEKRLKIL
jgi:hypothetical protein